MTCGRKSRMNRTRRSVDSSSGTRAKQPSGSGGFGSPSGQPESTKPSQSCRMPRMSRAFAISSRRISVISAGLSMMPGWSKLGLSTSPRSPPVHVATWTSTPSATYLAVDAAPLLDSSSGWACTCMSRSCSATLPSLHRGRAGDDAAVSGRRPAGSVALDDRVDVVGQEAVRLAMHRNGGLGVRCLDEAEHLAARVVDPVGLVVDAVLLLDLDVLGVRARDIR